MAAVVRPAVTRFGWGQALWREVDDALDHVHRGVEFLIRNGEVVQRPFVGEAEVTGDRRAIDLDPASGHDADAVALVGQLAYRLGQMSECRLWVDVADSV